MSSRAPMPAGVAVRALPERHSAAVHGLPGTCGQPAAEQASAARDGQFRRKRRSYALFRSHCASGNPTTTASDSQRQPATAGSSSMRRRLCRPASRPRLRPNRRHVPNLADLHAIPLEVPQPARREPPRERHAPLQQRAQVRRQNGSPRHARCPCPQAVLKSEPAKRHCGHGSGAIAQNGEGRHRAGPRLA